MLSAYTSSICNYVEIPNTIYNISKSTRIHEYNMYFPQTIHIVFFKKYLFAIITLLSF